MDKKSMNHLKKKIHLKCTTVILYRENYKQISFNNKSLFPENLNVNSVKAQNEVTCSVTLSLIDLLFWSRVSIYSCVVYILNHRPLRIVITVDAYSPIFVGSRVRRTCINTKIMQLVKLATYTIGDAGPHARFTQWMTSPANLWSG